LLLRNILKLIRSTLTPTRALPSHLVFVPLFLFSRLRLRQSRLRLNQLNKLRCDLSNAFEGAREGVGVVRFARAHLRLEALRSNTRDTGLVALLLGAQG
jgi:hypothetical protein